jgi:glycosyltransferase involved in cell wall biosynthesis
VNLSHVCNIKGEFLPYGPNHDIFASNGRKSLESMKVISIAKNAQSSIVGAFIRAMGETKDILSLNEDNIEGILHTNLYDPGDYDLRLLIDRYKASNVHLPEMFVSVKDGPSDEEMAKMFNNAQFYVDCSVKSATGLGMLEAMACGCIPIGLDSGRIGEIISLLPKEFQFFVPYETYIGASEEEYSVVSIQGLAETLIELKQDVFSSPSIMNNMSLAAIEVAKKFSNKSFSDRLSDLVSEVSQTRDQIAVDTF